ncbi:hypothetical protein PRUPE_3G034000 [Prunus persica]|uniref:DDE Tnp4 domain-containing protein n=1 Tax=Prunus persica TaxID=3760 RepID=M5WYC2_PRUPE|nr:hypothetical protein PRUPE_3G034000 [Prunus persica]
MAPPKKSKKSKKDRKLKKNLSLVPVEPKARDSDWWDSFFNPRRLLSVEKQVAITLRRLASHESQVSVGPAFGVGQSTVSQHHLKWPDSNRMEEIKSKLEEAFGLPNCCGAIDGIDIIMTLPTGIVDQELRFLDIVSGWPGGMTVSRLLKCSGFFKLCEGGQRLNENVRTLSGGVEIREYLVGAARSLAVTAFLQLKGTWRILNKVMWRPDKQKHLRIILVGCLLHNIRIDSGDILQPDVALSGHHDSGYGEQCCRQVDPLGRTMRDILVKHLLHSKQTAAPK